MFLYFSTSAPRKRKVETTPIEESAVPVCKKLKSDLSPSQDEPSETIPDNAESATEQTLPSSRAVSEAPAVAGDGVTISESVVEEMAGVCEAAEDTVGKEPKNMLDDITDDIVESVCTKNETSVAMDVTDDSSVDTGSEAMIGVDTVVSKDEGDSSVSISRVSADKVLSPLKGWCLLLFVYNRRG